MNTSTHASSFTPGDFVTQFNDVTYRGVYRVVAVKPCCAIGGGYGPVATVVDGSGHTSAWSVALLREASFNEACRWSLGG